MCFIHINIHYQLQSPNHISLNKHIGTKKKCVAAFNPFGFRDTNLLWCPSQKKISIDFSYPKMLCMPWGITEYEL